MIIPVNKISENKVKILIIFFILCIAALINLADSSKVTGKAASSNSDDNPEKCFSTKEYRVRGNSMYPVLQDGQDINVEIGSYACNAIERDDVVLVELASREDPIIKAVRGIPGDNIELRKAENGENIIINGGILVNSEGTPYVLQGNRAKMISLYVNGRDSVIPENTYLLLGNEPGGSYDSTRFGLLDKSQIVGKVDVNAKKIY